MRTPRGAFAIGVVHGIGGSAGAVVLLLASVEPRTVALVALVLFAAFTAISMTLISSGLGRALATRSKLAGLLPLLGVVSLGFGAWYTLAAVAPLSALP